MRQGFFAGAILVLKALANEIGITEVWGDSPQGQLALWQLIAKAMEQRSRLNSVRLARDTGAADVLRLPDFNEDSLYENLAWLADSQAAMEDKLFAKRAERTIPALYLYDVTSTYSEGEKNALVDGGYNRDRKKGKKQIVLGLLCDGQGEPWSIEAFCGNTVDTQTVASQIQKIRDRKARDSGQETKRADHQAWPAKLAFCELRRQAAASIPQ